MTDVWQERCRHGVALAFKCQACRTEELTAIRDADPDGWEDTVPTDAHREEFRRRVVKVYGPERFREYFTNWADPLPEV